MTVAVEPRLTIDDVLAEARDRYARTNPKSREQHCAAQAVMPGGNTRSILYYDPFPLAFVRGEGCYLWSADGRRYTDFLGEFTAGLYGHSHPVILEAIRAALDGGIGFGGHNLLEARLASLLCERFPSLELVRFTNSGTEANFFAVAASAAITGRRGVLVFDGGYHGGAFSFRAGGGPMNAPYDFVVGSYNDVEPTRELLHRHGSRLAAILVEPMQGSGGCLPASRDFLAMLRQKATECGAVLIFDEVMTSRLHPGGLQALHGITPDLTTLGKYLGGGMSFGAFGGRREIMERFDPARPGAFPHAGTFNNNILSMAAGVAGLSRVLSVEAIRTLNARGDQLRTDLDSLFRRTGTPMRVTGIGSLMTIHATAAPPVRAADLAHANASHKELLFFDLIEAGFWIARRCMITLSLPIGQGECDTLVDAVEAFVERRRGVLEAG